MSCIEVRTFAESVGGQIGTRILNKTVHNDFEELRIDFSVSNDTQNSLEKQLLEAAVITLDASYDILVALTTKWLVEMRDQLR